MHNLGKLNAQAAQRNKFSEESMKKSKEAPFLTLRDWDIVRTCCRSLSGLIDLNAREARLLDGLLNRLAYKNHYYCYYNNQSDLTAPSLDIKKFLPIAAIQIKQPNISITLNDLIARNIVHTDKVELRKISKYKVSKHSKRYCLNMSGIVSLYTNFLRRSLTDYITNQDYNKSDVDKFKKVIAKFDDLRFKIDTLMVHYKIPAQKDIITTCIVKKKKAKLYALPKSKESFNAAK